MDISFIPNRMIVDQLFLVSPDPSFWMRVVSQADTLLCLGKKSAYAAVSEDAQGRDQAGMNRAAHRLPGPSASDTGACGNGNHLPTHRSEGFSDRGHAITRGQGEL